MDNNKLIVTAAPHITSTDTTQKIMQRVCLALCPTLIASVIIFGINALILVAVTVAPGPGAEEDQPPGPMLTGQPGQLGIQGFHDVASLYIAVFRYSDSSMIQRGR